MKEDGGGGGGGAQKREKEVVVGSTKQTQQLSRYRAQELCESRGGRPGLPSLINLRFLWT